MLKNPEKVLSSLHLPDLMHKHGINLRYCGITTTKQNLTLFHITLSSLITPYQTSISSSFCFRSSNMNLLHFCSICYVIVPGRLYMILFDKNKRLRDYIVGFQMLARVIKNHLRAQLRDGKHNNYKEYKQVTYTIDNKNKRELNRGKSKSALLRGFSFPAENCELFQSRVGRGT
jgi:hypothetical protein